ncbi:MAG TPA: YciI family protein [Candidatus Binataceae bacterium]|jgi:hypothetical protein
MQYMLLIYESEAQALRRSQSEQGKLVQSFMTFTQNLVSSGKMRGGDRLERSTTATTVRVHNGKTTAIDGPFAETKEQLGGYYIVEAGDLDEAIAIAARIPSAELGSIEVRPVMQIPK